MSTLSKSFFLDVSAIPDFSVDEANILRYHNMLVAKCHSTFLQNLVDAKISAHFIHAFNNESALLQVICECNDSQTDLFIIINYSSHEHRIFVFKVMVWEDFMETITDALLKTLKDTIDPKIFQELIEQPVVSFFLIMMSVFWAKKEKIIITLFLISLW